jgi:hypothetical protein
MKGNGDTHTKTRLENGGLAAGVLLVTIGTAVLMLAQGGV